MEDWSIRAITLADSDWVQRFVAAHWGDTMVVVHGQVYYPHSLPGFMAQVGAPVKIPGVAISNSLDALMKQVNK